MDMIRVQPRPHPVAPSAAAPAAAATAGIVSPSALCGLEVHHQLGTWVGCCGADHAIQ